MLTVYVYKHMAMSATHLRHGVRKRLFVQCRHQIAASSRKVGYAPVVHPHVPAVLEWMAAATVVSLLLKITDTASTNLHSQTLVPIVAARTCANMSGVWMLDAKRARFSLFQAGPVLALFRVGDET